MAVYSILPKNDLTGNDIRDTLKANGGNVNNKDFTWFSVDANINKWSKYKPTKYTGISPDINVQYKGNNQLCGFSERIWNTGIPAKLYAAGDPYIYELPTGEIQYPYRPGDFRGYNPKQEPFLYSLIIDDNKTEFLYKDYNDSYEVEYYVETNGLSILDFTGIPMDLNSACVKADIYSENPFDVTNPNDYVVGTYSSNPLKEESGTIGIWTWFGELRAPHYYYLLLYIQELNGRYCMAVPAMDGYTVIKKILLQDSIQNASFNFTPKYLGDSVYGQWNPIGIYKYDNWVYVDRYNTYAGTRLDIAIEIENLTQQDYNFSNGKIRIKTGSSSDNLTIMTYCQQINTSYNPNRNYNVPGNATSILYFRFVDAFKGVYDGSNKDAYFQIESSRNGTDWTTVSDVVRIRIDS